MYRGRLFATLESSLAEGTLFSRATGRVYVVEVACGIGVTRLHSYCCTQHNNSAYMYVPSTGDTVACALQFLTPESVGLTSLAGKVKRMATHNIQHHKEPTPASRETRLL